MSAISGQGDGVALPSTPITSLSSTQAGSSLQGLQTTPVSITPFIIDSSVQAQGQTGTGIVPQQTFCFSGGLNTGSISHGVALPTGCITSPASAPQLNALPVGSMFNVSPRFMNQHFMNSITLPQQHQPNTPVAPQSLTISPGAGLGGSSVTTIPLNQVVGSPLTAPGINFLNQTILTMPPHPSTGQPQFIPQQFGQIPIMIGGHQLTTSTINALTTKAKSSSVSVISQPAPVFSTSSTTSAAPPVISPDTPAPVQAATVSPMLISKEQSMSKSSPDTTCSQQQKGGTPSSSSSSVPESTVSSTTGHAATRPATTSAVTIVTNSGGTSNNPTQNLKAAGSGEDAKTNTLSGKSPAKCARMKFTPVDPERDVDPRFHQSKALLENQTDDDDDSEVEDEEERASNSSGPMDVDGRGSPLSPSPPGVKLEPYDESERNSPEDFEEGKPSISPSPTEDVEDVQKSDTQGDLADVEDLEEAEFIWEDYLKETGATSVPPTAFKHVELSLQSGFVKGMKLEAPNKHSPNTYWVATVVMTCGPLLRLRYEGYKDNSSADFWSDPMTSDIHPVGWCEKNAKILQPPSEIQENHSDWNKLLETALENATLAPAYLLDKSTGATPVDQIREGMELEMQSSRHPHQVWLVKIMENVGGRLCLRYHGLEAANNSSHDVWLFYLDHRLHPLGWGKEAGYQYVPPKELKESTEKSEELIKGVISAVSESQGDQSMTAIFKDQNVIETHSFKTGMKLEAVDPISLANICPATVSEVIDHKYFVVEIDHLSAAAAEGSTATEKIRFCCHGNSPNIFPMDWASKSGIKLTVPDGWGEREFTWKVYLEETNGIPAPEGLFNLQREETHEFECGMKLEVVNPHHAHQMCAATVTKVAGPLLWVHLDSSRKVMDGHVESIHSLNLFPISWCVSNGYPLQPPRRSFTSAAAASSRKRVAVVQPEVVDESKATGSSQNQGTGDRDLFGGPQVYFNHRCFSGPFLSKGRIAELPRSVGPGPVTLVMKEVMSKLIQTAYKSSRVLRELQLEGRPGSGMTTQMLKAKYKGKSYRAQVEICRGANQLQEFCRNMCIKLQCCPNLVSPHHIAGDCPENCSQLTKTKYTYYYGKRKKIGRPPGGHTNLENGQKKPGKRKKRRRIGMMNNKESSSLPQPERDDQGDNDDDNDKASVCSDTRTIDSTSTTGSTKEGREISSKSSSRISNHDLLKRRYTHHIPPPSEIQTRGAKLPKYSFEKRTHKKIMIVEGEQRGRNVKKEPSQSAHTYQHDNFGGPKDESSTSFSPIRPDSVPMMLKSEPPLKLEKNPLEWSVAEVSEFLMTTDCKDRDLLQRLTSEEIDGQALLLLTLPNVQEYMGIKLGPAIKLCHLIERIKLAFYDHFAQ